MYNQETLINILKKIQGERSLNKFAEDINVDSAYLSRIFNYKRTNPPTPDILKKIANNSKGLTTYMELMIICGYITNENVEEINRSLKIYEHTRKLKIQLIKQIENVQLTNEELAIVKKYVDDKISGYLSKDNIKISIKYIRKCKKIMKELKEINNIPNINNKKVYNYCLNKLLVMTGDMMLFLVDMDISDKYNINYNFDLYENNNDTNVMVAEDSTPYSNSNTIKIPIVGRVAAGCPILAEEEIIDTVDIPKEWLKDGYNYFGLRVKGDSMFPRILDGDYVIVRQQNEINSGNIGIILINGDEAVVKQVYITDSGITLKSYNPMYPDMVFSKKDVVTKPVTIIGRVVKMIGNNFEE